MLGPPSSAADSMKRFVGGSEADTIVNFVASLCLNIQNVWYFDVLLQEASSAATCGAGVGVGVWVLAGVSGRRNDGSYMTLRRAGSDYDCEF